MALRGALDPPLERVGRYEIHSRIGQGGMAVVYRAALRGPVDATREVALKVVHPHLSADEHFVLMFLDEMRLAMALSHRNIVQTFDAGEDDGVYFMVMELVEGCSLHELLKRVGGPLPLDIALFIGLQVCSALEYAHTLDPPVTHRDVSPSNILISNGGDVKLADFGVAKAAGRIAVTDSSVLKGKVTYMSPEQARGRAGPPADIFALGAVLYEMISGERIRSSSGLERLFDNSSVPAILSKVRPEIPASLEKLVMSCVANEVEQRPASATALHHSLNQELFALLTATGQAVDSHRRLCTFLDQHVARADTPPPAAPAREALLARKLLEAAAEESVSAAEHATSAPVHDEQSRRTVAAPEQPPPPRRHAAWIVPAAVAGLVVAAVVVTLVRYASAPPVPAGTRTTTVVADLRTDPDTRAVQPADSAAGTARKTDLGRPERIKDQARVPRHRPVLPKPASLFVLARIGRQVVWADVLVDGQHVGQSPVQIPGLSPGEHLIEVRRDGYPPAERRLRLKPGQSHRVFIELDQ